MERKHYHEILDALFDEYVENKHITSKIGHFIENTMPAMIKSACETQIQREKRKCDLINASDEFISTFLLKHNYYYCPHNELFLNYDGKHFSAYSEDDIQHTILTQITSEEHLRPWKHKINNQIIKRIKMRLPLVAIPESITIQNVLKMFYPNIFSSRNHVKYFLTVIGDCLRDETNDNIYVVSPALKHVITEIGVQIYTYLGSVSSNLNCIKYKYYEHEFTKTRLLFIDNRCDQIEVPKDISKYAIDLLCVAYHYSLRYNSGDDFLYQCTEPQLVEHSLYLHRNPQDRIIDKFIEKCVQVCSNTSIKSKNMLFIWKKFLESKNIPNIIFHDLLMSKLKTKLSYDDSTDSFINVTSAQLPAVASFISFWQGNMIEDIYEPEMEIDEISRLLKQSCGKSVEDTYLIELIRHFYPDINIHENKYVLNVKCKLWDKRQEVLDNLEMFKQKCAEINDQTKYSLYHAYEIYISSKNGSFVVSKRYFEKIAKEYVGKFLDAYGIFDPKWWNSNAA